VKTYLKTLLRAFTRHITRFLSIFFMALICVGFVAGVGSTTDKINDSLSLFYADRRVSDFILKSTSQNGFSEEQIAAVRERYGENNVEVGASYDARITIGDEKQLVRLYFFDGEPQINRLQTIEKSDAPLAENAISAKAEEADNKIKGFALGTEITLDFIEIAKDLDPDKAKQIDIILNLIPTERHPKPVTVTVTEKVASPLLFAKDGEPSYKLPADTPLPDTIGEVNNLPDLVENVLYLPASIIPKVFGRSIPPANGDLYITMQNRSLFGAFSDGYKHAIEREKTEFLNDFLKTENDSDQEEVSKQPIITLYDNYSFVSLHSYADKVLGICIVLMVAFLLVTGLVVLSTMTRFLDEERAQIACLRTLGYSGSKIILKYILFALLATGLGGTGGYFVGIGVTYFIYTVFNFSFRMPPISSGITAVFFLITFITLVTATVIATLISGLKLVNEKPADLLRPKAPKAGKKVFLERIPFLWKPLPFRYKSTARNVLRYLGRFFMTVFAVAFSTALMMAALGLLDLCLFGGLNDKSILGVAAIVAVFAGLLTAVVVYTLTNINISERNKELATLKVLGYQDKEVASYIYREVYIDSIIGVLLGYPFSALLVGIVFEVIGLGTLGGISWFMWLIAPLIVLAFTAFVTLILKRKIVKIDMNESLKANE